MTPEYSSKLSPELKLFLSKLKDEEDPQVKILMSINKDLGPDQKSEIEIMGAEIRTVAGDIVTLVLPARVLFTLAKHDFVRSIELTRPLYGEEEDVG